MGLTLNKYHKTVGKHKEKEFQKKKILLYSSFVKKLNKLHLNNLLRSILVE